MLRNYLKVAYRNFVRNRFITSLNVIGLAIGMSSATILFMYIFLELSFDRFHKGKNEIFRVVQHAGVSGSNSLTIPSTLGYVAPYINQEFYPHVIAARMYNTETGNRFAFSDIQHVRFYYTDSTIFKIFTFPFIYGQPEYQLKTANSVVLTKHIAEKYFGEGDPVGKSFEIHGRNFTVTAVLRDIPVNSHLQFDLMLPFDAYPRKHLIKDMPLDFPTYVRINKNTLKKDGENKILRVIGDIVNTHYASSGIFVTTTLQPLKDIHLGSGKFDTDIHQSGDKDTIIILSFLAIFILLITISNVINLITSRSENRLREIGMRMIAGAYQQDILKQLVTESFLIALAACFVALGFTELFMKPFSMIVGINLEINYIGLIGLFGIFVVIAIITSGITGLINSSYLSRLSPFQVLSVIRIHHEISWIKIGLVIIQFAMMIFLLSLFTVLYIQVHFMKKKDPGFQRDGLLVYYEPFKRMAKDFEPVRKDFLNSANIFDATASEGIPGVATSVQNIWIEGETESNSKLIHEHRVKDHYVSTYGMEIIAGKDISGGKDTSGFLLNETAVKMLGLESPAGTVVNVDRFKFPVVGVVRDFQFHSLHDSIEPLVISKYFPLYRYITLRINRDSLVNALNYADSVLKIYYPDNNFSHFLLSDRYASMYGDEQKTSRLLSWGSLLAIVISILGLFGLSSQTVIKRTKEIGIRKANGGGRLDVMLMFLKDLFRWIFFSLVIALPLAGYVSGNWMKKFAYSIQGHWILIIVAGIFSLLIALLTVSYHTYSIGKKNPVDSLRYE
jgi:putative ABC transport system permease protein